MSEQSTYSAELLTTEVVEPGTIELQERATVDIQIATAHRFPRTLSRVKADMLSFATLDEETAQSCFYTLPRGGKVIQGPSIRMAEIAISCYGNVRVATRVVGMVTTGESPHVTVQAAMHDLEKNVAVQIEKRRRIVGKKKNNGRVDEDDINLAVNACSAIAFRDAAFKVIPQALIKPVYEQAKLVAVGDVKSLGVKRAKVFERLKQMGITEDRILSRVEAAKIDDVGLDKMEILIGLGTALKDGETTTEEAFPFAVKEAKVPASKSDDIPFNFSKPAAPAATEPAKSAPQTETPAVVTEPAQGSAASELAASTLLQSETQAPSETPAEQLVRLAAKAGIQFGDVEEWAKARRLNPTKDADAAKIVNAWATVARTLQMAGGAA